jgi:general secretion pathway protein G
MNARGFSFIELVVTLAIIAILALVAVPSAKYEIQRQKEHDLRLALVQIREAIDNYKHMTDIGRVQKDADASGYPRSLAELVQGMPDQASPDHRMIYFLRHLPADPFATDSHAAPEATWGLRSYASPPDSPAAGEDVYDVYSLSDKTGLNGVPYKKW